MLFHIHFCLARINHLQRKLFFFWDLSVFSTSFRSSSFAKWFFGMTVSKSAAQIFFTFFFYVFLLERTLIYYHRFPFMQAPQLSVMQLPSQSLRKVKTLLKALLQVVKNCLIFKQLCVCWYYPLQIGSVCF